MRTESREHAGRFAVAAFLLIVALVASISALPVQAVDPSPTPDPSALQQKLKDLRQRAAEQRTKIGLLGDRQAALARQLDALSA
jgi:hypothetical protein